MHAGRPALAGPAPVPRRSRPARTARTTELHTLRAQDAPHAASVDVPRDSPDDVPYDLSMKHSDFVHLHNHSDYSLLDGASPIPAMVRRAAELHMPALALTDHGA